MRHVYICSSQFASIVGSAVPCVSASCWCSVTHARRCPQPWQQMALRTARPLDRHRPHRGAHPYEAGNASFGCCLGPVPAEFTQAEVEEFERRVRNLSLFDRVQVTRDRLDCDGGC